MNLKKNKIVLYITATVFGLTVAGLLYWFYPFFLYRNTSGPITNSTKPFKEPSQPLSLSGYLNYLNSLDRSDPAAIASGINVLEQSIPAFSIEEADQSFLAFNTFYIEALNLCNETFWQDEKLITKIKNATRGFSGNKLFEFLNQPSALQKDPDIKNLVQKVASSGFILTMREGDFCLIDNPDFLYQHFSKYLSESLRVFLELRRQDATEGFAYDSAAVISFPTIAKHIIDWETYLDKYPESLLQDLANYYYQLNLNTFFFGTANFKVFEKKHLKPEVGKEYKDFIKLYAKTKSGNLISRYYELLRSNDFKYSKTAENFLRTNHVQIFPGIEP